MFLRKMEIDGFKSFANKITINFDQPLTAIVGPNGSGKSNVVDAIRWVLGEQSAKTLRGSNMADVIFAGSDGHRAQSQARVTLYLDNQENILELPQAEVRISRQVNKSGKSDYRINEQVCRLKDVQELLMDTGLGKDTYSIVGQGRITSILNSKPEKLRNLFEEAAGISKHKSRKAEAETRLENTNQDLQRIRDLIQELKKDKEPLKKEAEKSRKYYRLKGELTELETDYLLHQWQSISEERKKLEDKRKGIKKQINDNQKHLNSLGDKLERRKQEEKGLREELEKCKEDYYAFKTKKEEASNRINIIKEKRNSLNKEEEDLKNRLKNLKQENSKFQQENKKLDQKINSFKKQKQELNENLEQKRELLDKYENKKENIRENIEELRNKIEKDGNLQKSRTDLERYREKVNFLKQRLQDLTDEKDEVNSKIKKKNNRIKEIKQTLGDKKEEREDLADKHQKLKDKQQHKKQQLQQSRQKYRNIKDKFQQNKSHLKYLKSAEENYRGYYRGVKNILNCDRFSGIIGVVADIIEVKSRYVEAIETALGSREQNIVVEDDATARRAINYLKKEEKGRATLLPLNMIKPRPAEVESIKDCEGFLGLASGLVQCEARLKPVVKYLLGRTLIAENIDLAAEISKKINSRWKVVSLEGDVINPGGSITGGSNTKQKQGLLSRSSKIESCQEKIKSYKSSMEEEADKGLKIKEDLEEITSTTQKLESRLHQLKLEIDSKEEELTEVEEDHDNLNNKISEINKKITTVKSEINSADSHIERLKNKVEALNRSHSQERNKIEAKEEELKKLNSKIEEIKEDITEFKIKRASIDQQQQNLTQEKDDNLSASAENRQKLKEIKNRLQEIKEKRQELIETIREFKKKAERYESKVDKLNKRESKLEKDAAQLEEKVEVIREDRNQLQQQLDELKSEKHGLDLKISRRENKIENIEERLEEEYEIDPLTVVEEKEIEGLSASNYQGIEEKIKELKNSLKQLGPVNQNAEKEYQKLKSRIDYLEEQQQDLSKARRSINDVINKIETNMAALFEKTYYEVKQEFEEVFQELFEGGKAELSLTKPEDLLETGVEINAQPPGKQLKKLSLLSGGERALTAIALVFAFLNVNPSPFYILDEIDAPLDDANILKFARFIKKYSRLTQFIIVTHRKEMMTRADTLYGLTMQESGISELVSLQMEEEAVL